MLMAMEPRMGGLISPVLVTYVTYLTERDLFFGENAALILTAVQAFELERRAN
jgi:hypothetical protein